MNEINIEKNKQLIIHLLKRTKRRNINKLIEFLNESDFFIAPCSTKYHLHVPGGLAAHSLCVYDTFIGLTSSYARDIPYESQVIAALLHDVCKIGLYVENKVANAKAPYEHDDNFPIGHGEKSVIIIQKYISLTDQEIAMIRWHMAMYDSSFQQYSFDVAKKYPEAYLLYFADHISTLFVERQICQC